ncbi:methyltransferase type 11 [Pandoraea aquatica]|uniref:Methyltransferase type 11 n=1 Tax=Pandoraea aquatica TaxID=2508290 RepID=A0A5E4Z734_9BURK|nr:DUF3560 domain-containing protein [Pandoraea aquatica]VVE56956.1 methyltransferase type 11 [Pandoraea aquatica]
MTIPTTHNETPALNVENAGVPPAPPEAHPIAGAEPRHVDTGAGMTATYSLEDNKLRLYSVFRLPADLYQRVSSAGFIWAAKQDCFVAPMWTPVREDLLLELCSEIEEEGTSLVERAAMRAERFDVYSESNSRKSDSAHQAARESVAGIPMGQPILVGHHSEACHRRALERQDTNMRKAIETAERAESWARRAAAAQANAARKLSVPVRHRRIKSLEAEARKQRRNISEANTEASIKWATRWLGHYETRIAYEREMLSAAGGSAATRHDFAVGGTVVVRGERLVILRVNRSGQEVSSLTTTPPRAASWSRNWKISAERVDAYEPPTKEAIDAVAIVKKLPPIVNYPALGCLEMTRKEWADCSRDYKGTQTAKGDERLAAYRHRTIVRNGILRLVYIVDMKTTEPPTA